MEDALSQLNKDSNKSAEEIKIELSKFFLETLTEQKKNLEEIQGIIGGGDSFKNLGIFNLTVQKLSEDTRVPEKLRMLLKVQLFNLSPVGSIELVPGMSSYAIAIKNTLSILDQILTKEVSIAIHAYAEKIFIPPAVDYAKHRE